MNVALDIESTLADVATPFRNEYENRHGVRPEPWEEWDFEDAQFSFSDFMEITTSNWKHHLNAIPAMENGVMPKVHAIRELTDKVDIVTGRSGIDRQLRAWLDTKGVVYDNFVTVDSQEEKAEIGYQVLIDDCPKHVDNIYADQTLLLYNQPYNQHIKTGEMENVTRINSLTDAISKIEWLQLYS